MTEVKKEEKTVDQRLSDYLTRIDSSLKNIK